MKVWMVRAGRDGRDEDLDLEEGVSVIGFSEMPDLGECRTRDDIYGLYKAVYPDASEGKVSNEIGQLNAFVLGMEENDIVALPLKSQPAVALGVVEGPYEYRAVRGSLRHARKVKWVRADVPRTDFKQDMLYSLGAFMTVCRIQRNNAEKRFAAVLKGGEDPGPDENGGDQDGQKTDIGQLALDQIMSFIEQNFRGHDLATLVDAVLQAEGYITKVSSPGPDGGVDILAGRGTLGFEEPRLCVQVKSSKSSADVSILRALQGTIQTYQAQQGLLVSWGGFTRAMTKEAGLSFFSVRLWDAERLIDAILRNYDKLSEELQSELPLKRVWALVLEE